jgi:fucose permease
LLAAASACLIVAATLLMPAAFWGTQNAAASMNLGFVAVGAGFWFLPSLVERLCSSVGRRTGVLALAAISLLPAMIVIFTSPDEMSPPANAVLPLTFTARFGAVAADPRFWLAALTLLCYFSFQAAISDWSKNYFRHLGFDERRQRFWQNLFWLAFLTGRVLAGRFLMSDYELWSVLGLLAAAALIVGNLAGTLGRLNPFGPLLLALSLGPVLPSLLGAEYSVFVQAPGTALAGVFALGSTSVLFLAPLLNWVGRITAARARPSVRLPLLSALLVSAAVLVLVLIR